MTTVDLRLKLNFAKGDFRVVVYLSRVLTVFIFRRYYEKVVH